MADETLETRLECPVCVGVKMKKRSPPGNDGVVLDICPRCGGIWFERGEVQAVRGGPSLPDAGADARARPGRCPDCHAMVDRDAAECSACGHAVQIDCPDCAATMEVVTHDDLTLDVCRSCHGVWFDRHEVAAVWTLALGSIAVAKAAESAAVNAGDAGLVLLDALNAVDMLVYTPEVGEAVVEGAVHVAGFAVEFLSSVPELAGVIAEAAAATFEILLEAVAAILSGLS